MKKQNNAAPFPSDARDMLELIKYSLCGGEAPEIRDFGPVFAEMKAQSVDLLPLTKNRFAAVVTSAEDSCADDSSDKEKEKQKRAENSGKKEESSGKKEESSAEAKRDFVQTEEYFYKAEKTVRAEDVSEKAKEKSAKAEKTPEKSEKASCSKDKTANEQTVLSGMKDRLEKAGMKGTVKYIRILAAENELTELLEPYGIKPVVIKGTAAGMYYPDPKYRRYGDVDFVPVGGTAEQVRDIMLEAGYTYEHEYDERGDLANARHINLGKDGISFELHRIVDSDGKEGHDPVGDAIRASVPVKRTLEGLSFYSAPDAENGLALIWHIRHHLSSGIGLRQFTDWAAFVGSVLTDDVWETSFRALAEKCGLCKLAVHATSLCEKYLGAPHRKFAEEADGDVTDALMADVMESGNFGRKRGYVESRVANAKEFGNIFVRLQKGGLSRWKATWKHRWLRPFAWAYQLVAVSGELLKRPAEALRMGGYRKKLKKRKRLLASLK